MAFPRTFGGLAGPIPTSYLDDNFSALGDASNVAYGAALVAAKSILSGAVAGTQDNWNRRLLSVFEFMTPAQIADVQAGTLTQDMTAAINVAITTCKTLAAFQAGGLGVTSPYFVKVSGLLFPPGAYLTTDALWFGDNTASINDTTKVVESVWGYGAVIVGQTSGKPVIDMSGAFGTRWHGLTIFGSPTNSPNIGILLARVGGGGGVHNSAGAHRFTDVNVHGDFTLACVYNYASEINFWTACFFYQNSGLAVYYATNNNARRAVTSTHATLDTSVQSAYADFFSQCIIKNSTGNATPTGAVMYLESLDYGPSIDNCYLDSSGAISNPSIWMRNAQGLTSANTSAADQTVRVTNTTFEYRAVSDLIVCDDDHFIYDLTLRNNTMPVNGAGGFYHLKVQNTGKIKNLNAQKTAGDTLGTPFLIGLVGTGEIYNQEMSMCPTRKSLGGTDWDYQEGTLTLDGAFHTLNIGTDLTTPTNARFALVRVLGKTTAAADGNAITLRGDASTGTGAQFALTPSVNNIGVYGEGLVPLVNGTFQYAAAANFTQLRICVRGFYL